MNWRKARPRQTPRRQPQITNVADAARRRYLKSNNNREGDMMPEKKPNPTQNKNWLESISSPESRAKGMYVCHHVLGYHNERPHPLCPRCFEEK
jgi:hypothetical protein